MCTLALLLVLREAQGADMCQGGDGWTEHIPNASATVVPDDGWYTSDNAESCTAACIRHGLECDPDHDTIANDTIAKTEAEMQAVGTATGVYDGLGCGSFQDGGTRVAPHGGITSWYRTGSSAGSDRRRRCVQ